MLPLAAALLLLTGSSLPPPAVGTVEVRTRPVAEFRIGHAEKTFGPLEFTGGLELSSWSADFGAFSGMRLRNARGEFLGVADTGFWFSGRIEHDADGRPSGVSDFRMQAIVDPSGRPFAGKGDADAESIAVDGDTAYVGFERNHRVSRYAIGRDGMGPARGSVPLLLPRKELRMNRSLEALALRPGGGLVLVTERSLDAHGNILAAVLEGRGKGAFAVKRDAPFDVSDAAFLPNGDLLLLERSFSFLEGIGMRLRRIPAALVTKGALADGPVLMQADMGYQIDNMEALDVWRRDDGALMVSMMSDDNRSLLQRNLYLEFILREEPKPS